jgi:CBS domain-containing protein
MVKNYQGARITPQKGLEDQPISVQDHMTTQLVTFRREQSIAEVIDTLLEKGFSGAPVVNGRNELVGIISEGDCIKGLMSETYYNQPSALTKVDDCMVSKVVHIGPDVSIFEAAKRFLDLRIRRFPVLDDQGKLIGQISQKDVIRAIRNLKSNTWHDS